MRNDDKCTKNKRPSEYKISIIIFWVQVTSWDAEVFLSVDRPSYTCSTHNVITTIRIVLYDKTHTHTYINNKLNHIQSTNVR